MPPESAPTQPERTTTTIVANRDLAAIIRTIADRRDITMAETLEQYARPALMREYRKVLDELATLGDPGA